jgi:hypothetical protein
MIGRPAAVRSLVGALAALGTAAAVAAGPDPAPTGTPAGDPPTAAAPVAPVDPTTGGSTPAPAAQPAQTSFDASTPAAAAPVPVPAPAAAAAADAQPPAAVPAPAPARRAELPRREPVRPSLLPLAQPLWSDLSTTQRQVLAPFEEKWNALPLTEKRAWADLAQRFPGMKPDEQKRVEKRIVEWAALTPEQRRIARANYVLAQQIARENLLAEWEHYQSMTPEQRSVLGAVGNTGSNTAARYVTGPTGLAPVAAQPLPRRAPKTPVIAVGTDGSPASSGGVAPTVGPAVGSR